MAINSGRNVITIDGLAATGKSSLAKGLASRLKFTHLNTGLLYRAIAQFLIDNNIIIAHIDELKLFSSLSLSLTNNTEGEVCVELSANINGINQSRIFKVEQVQSDSTSKLASEIAVLPQVREFLLPVQRNAFKGMPIIAEGRDTGTVVFPDAEIKIFVEVPAAVRAYRRLIQLDPQALKLSKEKLEDRIKQIEIDILERDKRDQTRANAPCIPAKDAKTYLNTRQSLTQAIDDLYYLVSSSEGKL